MNKTLFLVFFTFLAISDLASAAEVAKIEIYANGVDLRTLSFPGPNSSFKFSSAAVPDTTLELRLIAPEPLIVEVKESIAGGLPSEATGKMTLLKRGDSLAVSRIKEGGFHSPYVLLRTE